MAFCDNKVIPCPQFCDSSCCCSPRKSFKRSKRAAIKNGDYTVISFLSSKPSSNFYESIPKCFPHASLMERKVIDTDTRAFHNLGLCHQGHRHFSIPKSWESFFLHCAKCKCWWKLQFDIKIYSKHLAFWTWPVAFLWLNTRFVCSAKTCPVYVIFEVSLQIAGLDNLGIDRAS